MTDLNRRKALGTLAALAGLAGCAGATHLPTRRARGQTVVVVGGGFGGATCARTLKRLNPDMRVVLLEPNKNYTACPLSNLVIGTDRPLGAQQFRYQALTAEGVEVIALAATDVDAVKQTVTLSDGRTLSYDRIVLAPGIDLHYAGLPGYSSDAAQRMPHAWQAGAQTLLLRKQLHGMRPGGTFVMAIPNNPYRCPPGPYERASLVAHFLKQHNPTAKVLLLDAKDSFSKQALFRQGWKKHYAGMIEWQGLGQGAAVRQVDADTMRLFTDFDEFKADVANVIPPQRAAEIARRAGVTDASGWCPVHPATFESRLLPGVHIIGDAAIANAMPKSAFAANAQGKFCAVQVSRMLAGERPGTTTLLNTCYSLLTPDSAVSVAGVYRPTDRAWQPVSGSGGTSPLKAGTEHRALEAGYARDWYNTLTRQVYG